MTQFSSSLLFGAMQITDAAARACYNFIGRGDKNAADQAATDAMRSAFDHINVSGFFKCITLIRITLHPNG